MFVQLVIGRLDDDAGLKAAIERWERELAPGAAGWLGTTAGVTDDGIAVAVVRFESEEAAQRNSNRAEQGEWWSEASQAFSGDIEFVNCSEVQTQLVGDPGQAGFVQVMVGRERDRLRARELMSESFDEVVAVRPELLGVLTAQHADGRFMMTAYFTAEEAARAGEQRDMPAAVRERMVELNSLLEGEPTYYDLREPWLSAP